MRTHQRLRSSITKENFTNALDVTFARHHRKVVRCFGKPDLQVRDETSLQSTLKLFLPSIQISIG